MKQKVILYGISNLFVEIYYSMKPCYDIVGISDRDCKKGAEYAEKLKCEYIPVDALKERYYDILYITTQMGSYAEIFREMVYKRGLERNKVQYYKEFYKEIEFSFGELNPDKTIYVLRNHPVKSGIVTMLCSLTGRMTGLPDSLDIYIDLMNYSNVYLEGSELGRVNAWEKWFVQPCGLTAQEVYHSKHVILCGIEDYSVGHRHFYNNVELERAYSRLYKKKVVLNSKVKELMQQERERLQLNRTKTCAVVFRGTDYSLFKTYGHFVQPTIEEMIDKVYELRKKWGFERIYFCTEDAKAHKRFLQEFGTDVICSERERIEEYPLKEEKIFSRSDQSALTNVTFDRDEDAFWKGVEYLRETIMASECDYIISGNTGGYWGILLNSDGFKDKYVFELGIYGIDDDSYATEWGHYVLIREEKEKEEQRMREYMQRCKECNHEKKH